MKELLITQYYCPEDGDNWSPAVSRALAVAENRRDTVLTFPKGKYDFYADGCTQAEYYPSNNDGGVKDIVFHLDRCENVIIDGQGSEFMFHGLISPFVLHRSVAVTVKNLISDTSQVFYMQAQVVAATETRVELSVDQSVCPFTVEGHNLIIENDEWRHDTRDVWVTIQEYSTATGGPAPHAPTMVGVIGDSTVRREYLPARLADLTASMTDDGHLVLEGNFGYTMMVGNTLIFTHERRDHSFALVFESRDTKFEDVTVYHAQSMGIACQCAHNITLSGCRFTVRDGSPRILSINADATHFVNCSGLVHIHDCLMEGMMDDGVNVHGIYTTVSDVTDNRHLTLELGHYQQFNVNVYYPGDEIVFYDTELMREVGTGYVESAKLTDERHIAITLQEEAKFPLTVGLTAENRERMPEVLIENCRIGRNRPRGVLLGTPKKAVVRGCTFYTSCAAVQIAGGPDGFWYESGATQDVLVENNHFHDCCYLGQGAVVHIMRSGCPVGAPSDIYHGKIVVRNNLFETFCRKMVDARLVRKLVVENNRFVRTDTYVARDIDPYVILHRCEQVITDISQQEMLVQE